LIVTRTGLDSLPPQSLWIHRIFLSSKVECGSRERRRENKEKERKRDIDEEKT
jgi:hypothetical protein